MNKAILLSGGMDSTALAYQLRPDIAITINYGQKAAKAEINASIAITQALSIKHEIIEIDCSSLGSGDMSSIAAICVAPSSDWWPFRNQLLLTLAAMRAIYMNVDTLYIGSVATDSNYKDSNSSFIKYISNVLSYQEGGIQVLAPAIGMTTEELIRKSGIPESILTWAHSCHISNHACGRCRGCNKHRMVMESIYGISY